MENAPPPTASHAEDLSKWTTALDTSFQQFTGQRISSLRREIAALLDKEIPAEEDALESGRENRRSLLAEKRALLRGALEMRDRAVHALMGGREGGAQESRLSMTTLQELSFLREWAASRYTGRGRIVDLGCWFGETSAALARGLRQNPAAAGAPKIQAYDLFLWEPWMNRFREKLKFSEDFQDGASFYESVRQIHQGDLDLIDFHQADLLGYDPGDEPIELLFLDANKAWALASSIYAHFLPRLIPGASVLVQQDYTHCDHLTAINVMSMWLLRDYTTWIYHVPESSSVVFTVDRPLPPAVELRPEIFSTEEIEAAYDFAVARLEAPFDGQMRLAKSLYFLQLGRLAEAEAALDHALSCGSQFRKARRKSFRTVCDGSPPSPELERFRARVAAIPGVD